ncbi:MAG: prepilin-type N-terminal cleavage/methylation domain-containing protein [Candidatus Falkowbacteria bacterium]|nr:prepilin-type N-terminal cleavage/methylation domain-containing protein [Candidatus Falkowbacteria bacterium]
MPKFKKSGFTLIELLVVIAIIGVLSTMAIIALGNARTKARDSRRLADIKQISTALELYYSDNNTYPTLITPGNSLQAPNGGTIYMNTIPSNPTPRNDGNCSNIDYNYSYITTSNTYNISTCLGSGSSNINAGVVSASPQGTFSCGQNITDRDGYVYTTVQIGPQCWMKQNLRTKTKPNGVAMTNSISDNILINSERSCPAVSGSTIPGTEDDCAAYGALYTWAAVMNGTIIPGTQGICPDGWHVPTDAEFGVLEQYVADPGQSCDVSRNGVWACDKGGDKLQTATQCRQRTPCGSSGFDAQLAGTRGPDGSTFSGRGYLGWWGGQYGGSYMYTSSLSGVTYGAPFYRAVHSEYTLILKVMAAAVHGLSLRCIKN